MIFAAVGAILKTAFSTFLNLTDDFFTGGSFTHAAYLAAQSQCAICDDLAAIKKDGDLKSTAYMTK